MKYYQSSPEKHGLGEAIVLVPHGGPPVSNPVPPQLSSVALAAEQRVERPTPPGAPTQDVFTPTQRSTVVDQAVFEQPVVVDTPTGKSRITSADGWVPADGKRNGVSP